ncbi:MAG: Ig-like domain-containing protein [Prevotella sp.]|nr:Ig-like domain-containing protein [Prevotella sp.]
MKIFTKTILAAFVAILFGGGNVHALESYDFQDLSQKLRTLNGNGGPWAVNDGGDAGFTINDAAMHYLGDYTEQGFIWNQRFAYEYVEGRGKFTMRSKSASKDKNCGMFSWDYDHYFSILDLKDGDKVTITTLAGTTSFVSTNVTAEVSEGDAVASGTTYTISTTEESTRLDIKMAKATLIAKIEIEPYGVETVPVITMTPKTLNLIPGATYKLSASVSPAADTQWTSSNEAVATVAADGTVTAVAAGEATISCSWASQISDATASDACVVTVANINLNDLTLAKTYDFTTMGDVTLELQEEAAGAIWNEANSKNNNVFYCTNEGLELIAVQAAVASNKGWSIVDGQGLFLASGAGRCAAIGGIKAGQVVEFIYTGNGFYTRSDDDGIEKTALNEGIGRAIYLAEADGMIGFELDKGNAVKQINIYESTATGISNINAAQNADAPIYNMAGQKVQNAAAKGLYIINGKKVVK